MTAIRTSGQNRCRKPPEHPSHVKRVAMRLGLFDVPTGEDYHHGHWTLRFWASVRAIWRLRGLKADEARLTRAWQRGFEMGRESVWDQLLEEAISGRPT